MARVQQKTHAAVTTGPAGYPGPPCATGFNGFLRALPGDHAWLPPSVVGLIETSDFSACVGAPGPHDFAVRTGAARLAPPPRPSQPASTYRDDAYAPLHEAGWLKGRHRSEKTKSGIFFAEDLDEWNRVETAREIRFFARAFSGFS